MTDHERKLTDAGYDPETVDRMTRRDAESSRTEEIEREIQHTRARMTRDIDEISERLRPANLARDTVETVRHEARRTGYQLADLVRENSLAVAAVGLGATWWFVQRDRGPVSGDRMSRYAYTASEPLGGAYDRRGGGLRRRIGDTVHDARDAVSNAVSNAVSDAVTGAAGSVAERARSVSARASHLRMQARKRGRRAKTGVEHTLEDNPLLLVAGAAVLGLTIGLLLPSTQPEDELLGPTRDRLADRAGETVDRAKEA